MTASNHVHRAVSLRHGAGRMSVVALALVSVSWVGALAAQAQDVELIIRNGLVVTIEGRMEADIRIRGETIAEIGPRLSARPGTREIDARGMILMPGAVDTHTHLNQVMPDPPQPYRNQDDYESGSAAAYLRSRTTAI